MWPQQPRFLRHPVHPHQWRQTRFVSQTSPALQSLTASLGPMGREDGALGRVDMAARISRNRFEPCGNSVGRCHTEDEDVKDFVDPIHGPACQQPCARPSSKPGLRKHPSGASLNNGLIRNNIRRNISALNDRGSRRRNCRGTTRPLKKNVSESHCSMALPGGTISTCKETDRGKHHVSVGIGHRPRSELLQVALNKMRKTGSRVAAHDARATTEGEEVGRNTSGDAFVAGAKHITSALAWQGGKVDTRKGGLQKHGTGVKMSCALYFWHGESLRGRRIDTRRLENSGSNQKSLDHRQ